MKKWWPLRINTSRLERVAYTTSSPCPHSTHTHTCSVAHDSPTRAGNLGFILDPSLPCEPRPHLRRPGCATFNTRPSPAPKSLPPSFLRTPHLRRTHSSEILSGDHVWLVSWHLLHHHSPLPGSALVTLASVRPHPFPEHPPQASTPSPERLSRSSPHQLFFPRVSVDSPQGTLSDHHDHAS